MIWIPITLVAAGSQSVRNALQRYLKGRLSTNGAAFTRFLFGVPLATIYLVLLLAGGVGSLPSPGPAFWGWVVAAGLSQIVATSLTIHVMAARNFATGIAYAKTEVVQAALFEIVFLGAVVGGLGAVGIALATFAVMLMSVVKTEHPLRASFSAGRRPTLSSDCSRAVSWPCPPWAFARPPSPYSTRARSWPRRSP